MKKLGFSLAEALITLLIISITTAALAPTITTRRNAALNPNLYWSASGSGVIAAGSKSNVSFAVGADPSATASLTVGNGSGAGGRNALQISGVTTSTGNITTTAQLQGATVTDGTAEIKAGAITKATTITASGEIKGGTLTSTGNITASNNITATGQVKGASLNVTGTFNQLQGGVFLTTSACPSAKWSKGSALTVCTSEDCKSTLTLYPCTYSGT